MSDTQTHLDQQAEAQRKLLPLLPVYNRRIAAIVREAEAIRSRLNVLVCMAIEMAGELEASNDQPTIGNRRWLFPWRWFSRTKQPANRFQFGRCIRHSHRVVTENHVIVSDDGFNAVSYEWVHRHSFASVAIPQ